MEQEEYFGFGSIKNLENILEKENAKNIFLVRGKSSYELSGAKQHLKEIISNYNITEFYDFSSNPKLEEIKKGFGLFRDENYDVIVVAGGGSSIDVAKAIKLFYYEISGKKIPLVAIPTTAGSGSEATHFIVYYIGKEKQSKGNPEITLPDYSICDPELTLSLPKEIVASTGMDALSQAVESYWSVNSTEISKKNSAESINLIFENLERAVNTRDRNAKEKMMLASNLAGKSINITKTTACHAVAYPITSYFEISHGHAAALTLGKMLVYNSEIRDEDCKDKRGISYVKETIGDLVKIIGAKNAEEASNKIKDLMKSIGLKTNLSDLGINEKGIETIIQNGFNPERVKNNPRVLTEEELREILLKIF